MTDPLYSSSNVTRIVFGVILVFFVIVYICWLGYSLIRAFSESRRIGNERRVYTYGALVITCIILFALLLVASFFMGLESSATTYMATLAYANLFVYLMSVLYIPRPTSKCSLYHIHAILTDSLGQE